MILQRIASRRARTSTNFCNQTFGQCLCKIWEPPQIFEIVRSMLRSGASSQATTSGCKDHEYFKRMAMNRSFPRTQDSIQSVQGQVKALIGCKDAYNMQIFQDWSTFRWPRITILQQNVTARCYYFWSGTKIITETDTDVILGWGEFGVSYSSRYSNNSVHVAPGREEHSSKDN